MKKIFTLSSVIFILCTSCEVLDVEPAQSISAEAALRTRAGVQQALNGCYDAMQFAGYYGRNYILASELAADNGIATGTIKEYKELANNSLLADNAVVESIWNAIYTAINRANNVIYYAPGIKEFSGAELDNILGQARFLRALHHFNLIRYFGPVPMKTLPSLSAGTELNSPRVPLATLYNFIISDLEYAETRITNTNKAMATQVAATALLAKVYQHMGDWGNAKSKASIVIQNPSFQLLGSYGDLFSGGSNSETIFYLAFDEQDKNRMAEYFLPTAMGGRKEIAPSPSLIGAFEAGDTRKAATIGNPNTEAYGLKYTDLSTGTDKVYILRLAEMYLIRAEAIAREDGDITDISNDINALRSRAMLLPTPAINHADLLLAIEQERRAEFAFEGHRWFDLVRTNRAMQYKPTVTQACQMLFPIPLSEIQTNDAIQAGDQNPCY